MAPGTVSLALRHADSFVPPPPLHPSQAGQLAMPLLPPEQPQSPGGICPESEERLLEEAPSGWQVRVGQWYHTTTRPHFPRGNTTETLGIPRIPHIYPRSWDIQGHRHTGEQEGFLNFLPCEPGSSHSTTNLGARASGGMGKETVES